MKIVDIFSHEHFQHVQSVKERSIHLLVSHHRYHRLAIKRLGRMSILSAQRKSSSSSSSSSFDMVCYLLFRAHIIIDAQANALIESHSICEKHSLRSSCVDYFESIYLVDFSLSHFRTMICQFIRENFHQLAHISIEIRIPWVCPKNLCRQWILKKQEF